jgi:hypothetical protein
MLGRYHQCVEAQPKAIGVAPGLRTKSPPPLPKTRLAPGGASHKAMRLPIFYIARALWCPPTAAIAARWHDARERRAIELQTEEGPEWFAKRQRFLAMTDNLALLQRRSQKMGGRG